MADVSYTSALNPKRDLGDEFAMIVAAQPTLLSIVQFGGGAVSNKHEWLEYVLSANTDTLSAAVTSTGQATITPTTMSKFAVGQILAFEGADEIMQVASLGTTTVAVTRGYGSSDPDATIANGSIVRIVATPLAENSAAGDDPGANLVAEYNYTQIFARTAVVSGTAENAAQYGIDSLVRFRINEHLISLARELNNAVIYGRRLARDVSNNGSMGGILEYLTQAGGNSLDAAGATLSQTLLNNLLEDIVEDGGDPDAIICNTVQARKITALNASPIQVERADTTAGFRVLRFVGDLPVGNVQRIVVDVNFPKDKVAFLDTSQIKVVPFANRVFKSFDATTPGTDGVAERVIGEYTAEIRNARYAHGVYGNLSTS